MRVTVDLGFSSLVLVAVVCVIFPTIGFVVRYKWRRAVARTEEIKRLLVFAAEESARVESEAAISYQYAAVSKQYPAVSNQFPAVSKQQDATVSVDKNNHCAVCYRPTTARCARCKAVHYCSGKCQIVHWRQGHKEECHPATGTARLTNDLLTDPGKKVAEPDYQGINDEKSLNERKEYTTAFEKPPLPDRNHSPKISCAKDDNGRVDLLAKENIADSNTELSCNSFSGFSATTNASESSDDSSVSESIISNEQERSQGHDFSDHTRDVPDITSNGNSIGAIAPLSPKFARLVDSVDGFSTMPRLNKVRPGFAKEEIKHTSNGSSGLMMPKGAIIEPSILSSGFWNVNLDFKGRKDDSLGDFLPSHSNESLTNSVVNNLPNAVPESLENKGVDPSGCADVSSIHNLQTVGFKESNHVMINPGSSLKSAEIRDLPHTFSDTKLLSRTEEEYSHSHNSTKCESNGIHSGTSTSSQVASASPKSKNGLKTSISLVVDQFSGSNLSKQFPLAVRSDVTGKYSDKGLFPYDLFVKLYNWNRVEFQPFGLTNCGNSCYANAVLQCLAFTPPLTAYLLQGLHSKSCANKKWCFTCEFERLILNSKDTKSPQSPMGILSQLQTIGSQLSNGREEDAHEFLRHVVETMQSICLMESGVTASDSLREETNLLGLTFGGYLRSKIKCMKCEGKSERRERVMDLTVEIEGDIETLEEALRRYTSTETLDGENKYHCVRCKTYEKAKKKMTVSEAPNVLTIALKRFRAGKFGKLNKSIRFPEILDLAPFMSGTSDLAIYRLYGVVVHLDVMNASFSGHYVCYVKNYQNSWFKADDSVVTTVDLETVLTKGAYMLFYARCSPRAPRLIRKMVVSSDSKSKINGKTVTMKSRYKSSDSGFAPSMTSWISPDGSAAIDTIYPKFHLKRILEEDSSSDNSSLISNNSDEGSCSTDSTFDSTGSDDFADYIFGNFGRGGGGMARNSNPDSIFTHPTGTRPPSTGQRVEIDDVLYRRRQVDVERSEGGVSRLHRNITIEHRKLDTNRGSSSFSEADSLQRAGSNPYISSNSGVSYRKPM